jgi:hypothetical protein
LETARKGRRGPSGRSKLKASPITTVCGDYIGY